MRPASGRIRPGGRALAPPPFRSRPASPISCGQIPCGSSAEPKARRTERKPMSQKAMQRLSFFLLMGLTLYASFVGAG